MISDLAVLNRVRMIRQSQGLTQADLSQMVEVTRQTIISIEKGRLNPSILVCLRIAQALNCNIGQLFYLDTGLSQNAHVGDASALLNNAPLAQNG